MRTGQTDGISEDCPVTLFSHILYLSHHPTLAGHTRREVCTTRYADTFISCTWLIMCTHRILQLFPSARPHKLRATDILGTLPKSTNWGQLVIIKKHVLQVDTSNPTARVNSTPIVTIFVNNSVLKHGLTSFVLTENGPRSVSRSFTAIWFLLGVKKLTATRYYLPTTG